MPLRGWLRSSSSAVSDDCEGDRRVPPADLFDRPLSRWLLLPGSTSGCIPPGLDDSPRAFCAAFSSFAFCSAASSPSTSQVGSGLPCALRLSMKNFRFHLSSFSIISSVIVLVILRSTLEDQPLQ